MTTTSEQPLTIRFALNTNFYFIVELDEVNLDSCTIEMAPGKVENVAIQHYEYFSIEEIYQLIPTWIECLEQEVKALAGDGPEIRRCIQKFEELLEEHITDPDSHFTEGEKSEWMERLSALEESFVSLREQNSAMSEKLTQAIEQIEMYKVLLDGTKKGAWIRSFGKAIIGTFGVVLNSKSGQVITGEITKKLIGEE
ncbi:MAG: hypothetical protein RLY93_17025 [Sumerlaeia bacterium]